MDIILEVNKPSFDDGLSGAELIDSLGSFLESVSSLNEDVSGCWYEGWSNSAVCGVFPSVHLSPDPVSTSTVHSTGEGDFTPVTSSGDLISVVLTGPSWIGGGLGYSRHPLVTVPGSELGLGDFGCSSPFGEGIDFSKLAVFNFVKVGSSDTLDFFGFNQILPSASAEAVFGFTVPGVDFDLNPASDFGFSDHPFDFPKSSNKYEGGLDL